MSQYVPVQQCPEKFCPDLSQNQGVFFLTIKYFVLFERNLRPSLLLHTFLKNFGDMGTDQVFPGLARTGTTPPTLTLISKIRGDLSNTNKVSEK